MTFSPLRAKIVHKKIFLEYFVIQRNMRSVALTETIFKQFYIIDMDIKFVLSVFFNSIY